MGACEVRDGTRAPNRFPSLRSLQTRANRLPLSPDALSLGGDKGHRHRRRNRHGQTAHRHAHWRPARPGSHLPPTNHQTCTSSCHPWPMGNALSRWLVGCYNSTCKNKEMTGIARHAAAKQLTEQPPSCPRYE